MTETIHRLVYYSRNRASSSPEDLAAAIQRILAASRRNNARVGVTGALMFNAGCFAQVLEGPQAAVAHTFERIQQDEQHGEVSVLSFAPAAGRAFERWSMGFVGDRAAEAVRYAAVANESGYDPSRMTGDALFETLHRLVLEEESGVPQDRHIG
ncbi:BLUF domain-containing protein [Rhodopila sp.]|uniref:BLUF domain-containing protein n=1 Tax=Rhodopila sp. TaxID=2480087 RepID=UPI003D0F1AA8